MLKDWCKLHHVNFALSNIHLLSEKALYFKEVQYQKSTSMKSMVPNQVVVKYSQVRGALGNKA